MIGLEVFHEAGVFDPSKGEQNYRQPDLIVVDPQRLSERGIEGRAELVVEVLSPNDESRDNLPFYARCQVQEIWLIDPYTRATEVYTLIGDTYQRVPEAADGTMRARRLDLELRVIDGPKLRIAWADGVADV